MSLLSRIKNVLGWGKKVAQNVREAARTEGEVKTVDELRKSPQILRPQIRSRVILDGLEIAFVRKQKKAGLTNHFGRSKYPPSGISARITKANRRAKLAA